MKESLVFGLNVSFHLHDEKCIGVHGLFNPPQPVHINWLHSIRLSIKCRAVESYRNC